MTKIFRSFARWFDFEDLYIDKRYGHIISHLVEHEQLLARK